MLLSILNRLPICPGRCSAEIPEFQLRMVCPTHQIESRLVDSSTKRRSRSILLRFVLAACFLSGCLFSGRKEIVQGLPSQHTVRSDQLLVYSDFRISPDHELISDLKNLRHQVYDTLELPVQRRPVTVYLFDNERAYRDYLSQFYPDLPPRRAYFFKTSQELAVFTYWGEKIQEDLRHEFTHGLLHASLKSVPLWLDEGLAEYFEVIAPQPGELNGNYVGELTERIGNGWRPAIERLEGIEEFSTLQRVDYQESWAWVHFMLHHTPETRQALLGYLQDLRVQNNPYPLSKRLEAASTEYDDRFLVYISSLNTFHDGFEKSQRSTETESKPGIVKWANDPEESTAGVISLRDLQSGKLQTAPSIVP